MILDTKYCVNTPEKSKGAYPEGFRPADALIIIPAYNEEKCIGMLLDEVANYCPGIDVVVISDGSSDSTADIARYKGVEVLDLPFNVGVGGAVQSGFIFALENGYKYAIRIDGDGQHPPEEIYKIVHRMLETNTDLVIGTRFASGGFLTSSLFRFFGIKMLAVFLSAICRKKVTDPTSGFWMINRKLLYYFSEYYPVDYPEPEAIALLRRQGFSYEEAPVNFRQRLAGISTIRTWGTVYYAMKVGLALLIDRIRPIKTRYTEKSVRNLT